ncbi:uncharacterized protein LOC136041289 isoform X2 [Artemia franciscana]|uniref:uncharacterized protein LOC136041289 isoform X2 n=1 Tax=Artemia franciscana TaxID=6661 RepID=UPI0032D9D639
MNSVTHLYSGEVTRFWQRTADLCFLWCSFEEPIPLADGVQEDREETDSINQGVNNYPDGVFRTIKDIRGRIAIICLFFVPVMLAGFGRGMASREFPRNE